MKSLRRSGVAEMRWTIVLSFLLLILPAIAGWLTAWRWQPWPIREGEFPSAFRAARDQAMGLAQHSLVGL
ncbi:MAG: hypothetical protein AAGC67_22655 [Myxococcota bacterium]